VSSAHGLVALAAHKPFNGDCASMFTAKEVSSAIGAPVKDVSRKWNGTLFEEEFAMSATGALICDWRAQPDDFEWSATAYVLDDALVAFPGDTTDCVDRTDPDAETTPGDCFFTFESNGLWAAIDMFRADGFDDSTFRTGGAALMALFAARAQPEARAGIAELPEGVWPTRTSCDDFTDIDFSALAKEPYKLVVSPSTQGRGEANGRVAALVAAGGIQCDIAPTKKNAGYTFGSFFVLPGTASALGKDVGLTGKEVSIPGADSARLFDYPNLEYVVTSGPNVLIGQIYIYKGKRSDERDIVTDILAVLTQG
jgi:hypothetical protein